ncbi:MAG: hypothetical protein Q8P68_04725 [Candidatus Peregrinibacteria bacterium]|nr:hypothetical protein [Candidatus Peregrinibacteria bacterium]
MASLSPLIKSGKTIFTTNEITELWGTTYDSARNMIMLKVRRDEMYRIKPGIFTLNKNYNQFELGCKMMPGSYISLYSVLKKEGVIFQEFSHVYLIGPRARQIEIEKTTYEYHTIKKMLFLELGVKFNTQYSIASIERAILDCFTVFDTDFTDFNISKFNKELFLKLLKFYNKKVQKKASQFLKYFEL